MNLHVLKLVMEKEREYLKNNGGAFCAIGEHGPVSMKLVEAVIAYAESLEERLAKLESRPS